MLLSREYLGDTEGTARCIIRDPTNRIRTPKNASELLKDVSCASYESKDCTSEGATRFPQVLRTCSAYI